MGTKKLEEKSQSMPPNIGLDGKIPVFVFPNSISFYLDNQRSHKQILTLYNPYDFPIKFNVLCTSPKKFTVVDPSGSIKPRCCVDLVVRHVSPIPGNCLLQDKLRVQVQDVGNRQVIGKRDVPAVLYPGKADASQDRSSSDIDEFNEFKQVGGAALPDGAGDSNLQQYSLMRDGRTGRQGTNLIVVAAAILCTIALLLPTEGDTKTSIPSYLHLSLHQKLIFAYTLGLVTMVVLRST